MKIKIIGFIVVLSICLYMTTTYNVKAADKPLRDYNNIVIVNNNGGNYFWVICSDGDITSVDNGNGTFTLSFSNNMHGAAQYGTTNISEVINYVNSVWINSNFADNAYGDVVYISPISIIKGTILGAYPGQQVPTPEPTPDPEEPENDEWYNIAWDTFSDYFTDPVPFRWFKNLINRVFGDDNHENNISDNVTITSPTLTPSPTPIPYSTVVIPKTDLNTGDTYYETNYIYENPSGTPIVQPYPPTSAPAINSGGSGNTYYPFDGEPLKLPKLNWLSPVTIGDSNYDGIDSIYDGLSSVDDIGSEYTDGISAVSDATSVLPTNWLLLIGIAAAIPLIAGIISRFLS